MDQSSPDWMSLSNLTVIAIPHIKCDVNVGAKVQVDPVDHISKHVGREEGCV